MTNKIFDTTIYKKYNKDLEALTDDALLNHFLHFQNEPRIYGVTHSTTEFLSMRWLRGSGIEFGAGSYPTKLYGNATSIEADSDPNLLFRGKKVDKLLSIDASSFLELENHFDFSIASHVLEHADSFLKAIENLILITKNGCYIYLVLPDIRYLYDFLWMPYFSFSHHEEEYLHPLLHAKEHDLNFISSQNLEIKQNDNMHAILPDKFLKELIAGEISPEHRFLCHKHNYDFQGWINLLFQTKNFFKNQFSIEDIRYGYERQDCHFILKVTK